jgi:chromosome partitioning protein
MIISVVNQKGGTGKTTTTINLGSALAEKRKKVLLVDFDPQGNLSYCLGLGEPELSMSEVMSGEVELEEILQEAESMSIAPSGISLADIELSLAGEDDREGYLKEALGDLSRFDVVLIDCPPSLSLLTVNALSASEGIIIPMQMEVLSLQGLDQITHTTERIQKAYNPELHILGILPVMVDSRRKLSFEIREYIDSNYDYHIFDAMIRTNVKASESPSFGQSVLRYAPKAHSAQDYRKLAKELLTLIK